jgi:hypothetical protein
MKSSFLHRKLEKHVNLKGLMCTKHKGNRGNALRIRGVDPQI